MAPDDPDVTRFLAGSMVVRVATLSAKGHPHLMPVWFILYGGRFYMTNAHRSPTVRNIAAHPSVVLLFHGERTGDRRVLRVHGIATFRKEAGLKRKIVGQMIPKYYVAPGALRHMLRHLRKLPLMARYYMERNEPAGLIEVVPERAEFLGAPYA